MLASTDNNPLRAELTADMKARYLFGGRAASAGLVNPERALDDFLAGLGAHTSATSQAARAVVAGTLRELSPAQVAKRANMRGAKLFEGARLWDAYVKLYQTEEADMDAWVNRLLDRYFAEAYLREIQRLERTRKATGAKH